MVWTICILNKRILSLDIIQMEICFQQLTHTKRGRGKFVELAQNFVTPSMNGFIGARCCVQSSTFAFLSLSRGRERIQKYSSGKRIFAWQVSERRSQIRAQCFAGGENTDVCVSCGEKEREKIEREKRMEERVWCISMGMEGLAPLSKLGYT